MFLNFVSEYQIDDEKQLSTLVKEYYQKYLNSENSSKETRLNYKGETHIVTTNRDELSSLIKDKQLYYEKLFDAIEKKIFFREGTFRKTRSKCL